MEAVNQFKHAIEEAKLQVISNQNLSQSLSNELRLKQRLLDEEQKTTDKLIEVIFRPKSPQKSFEKLK